MNEETIRQALSQAYPADRLTNERLLAIGGKVRQNVMRRRRRRVTAFFGLAFAVVATVGFTYPIAAANLLGPQIASKMAAMGPYQVKLTILGNPESEGRWTQTQMELIANGKDEIVCPSLHDSGKFEYIVSNRQMHVIHPASKVDVVYPSQRNAAGLLNAPLEILDQLADPGQFDVRKRIEDLGNKTVNGKRVQELALKTGRKYDLILDIDSLTGALVSMTIPTFSVHASNFPAISFGMRFDYVYDPIGLKKRIAEFKSVMAGCRKLSLDEDRGPIQKEVFSNPLSVTATGRDVLRVYQVQEDPVGNVFVLYTCQGYHADSEMQRAWLQMTDQVGVHWATDSISMGFGKIAPQGQGLKAQLFVSPTRFRHARKAILSLRLNEWEFLGKGEPSRKSTSVVQLGSFAPSKVESVPIWFYFAFGVDGEGWVKGTADRLRSTAKLPAK